jgi:hypothetical protein
MTHKTLVEDFDRPVKQSLLLATGCKRPLRYFFSPLSVPDVQHPRSSSAKATKFERFLYTPGAARIPHRLLLERLPSGILDA